MGRPRKPRPLRYEWHSAVVKGSGLRACTRAVCSRMFESMDEETAETHFSLTVERIRLDLGVSCRTVQRALRDLERFGWIVAVGSRTGGAGNAVVYRARIPQGRPVHPKPAPEDSEPKVSLAEARRRGLVLIPALGE